MIYMNSDKAPKTAEEYERQALARTKLTAGEARRILSAHQVRGRSKMSAEAAVDMALEQWPEEAQAAREAKVVRYRWPVAHGLQVTYDELAETGRRSGVTPLPEPGNRGSYATAEDVAKVYSEGSARRAVVRSVRVRVSCDSPADDVAARAIKELLAGTYECTVGDFYSSRCGRGYYFDVAVPKNKI